jgi:hypothetical protein
MDTDDAVWEAGRAALQESRWMSSGSLGRAGRHRQMCWSSAPLQPTGLPVHDVAAVREEEGVATNAYAWWRCLGNGEERVATGAVVGGCLGSDRDRPRWRGEKAVRSRDQPWTARSSGRGSRDTVVE